MASFERWDVFKFPYPYTNRPVTEHRPALLVAVIDEDPGLLSVMMMTSAGNRFSPSDVAIGDAGAVGLPAPSVVPTARIATVDTVLAARLSADVRHEVRELLRRRIDNAGEGRP